MTENQEKETYTGPKILITAQGARIIDPAVMEKIKNKNLSASMVSSFLQCPFDWVMENYVLPEIEHEETPHLIRGECFHAIMENFFALPKEERTGKQFSVIAKEQYEKFKDGMGTDGAIWLKEAIYGYKQFKPNPKAEEIFQVKNDKGDLVPGLEYFVKGSLGKCKRNIVGFVDKMVVTPEGILIQDWKTGKKAKAFDPTKKISASNDFGYIRQQTAYAMLLEQEGYEVSGAELIYPIAGTVLEVKTRDKKTQKKVVEDFEELEAKLEKCIEENNFPYTNHCYCKWCKQLMPHLTSPRFPLKINLKELQTKAVWGQQEDLEDFKTQ